MQHVLNNALVIEEVADDPIRYLVLGPDRSGNLLELVVMDRPQGPAVIHAMTMREQYRHLLPKGWHPRWRDTEHEQTELRSPTK